MKKVLKTCVGLALCIAAGLVVAPGADAHRLYCGGTWCHHHTRYYYTLNEGDYLRYEAMRGAQIDWHNSVRLDLSSTSCHGCSRIHMLSANYYPQTWQGLAEACAHCSHSHVRVNAFYLYNYNDTRSVTCEEIGHVIGLDHAREVANDCMNQTSVYVGSHSANDVNYYYQLAH